MTRTVKIYRFEAETGYGMYVTGAFDECDPHRHPAPYEDKTLRLELTAKDLGPIGAISHRYGFRSLAQARRWMFKKHWLDKLRIEGIQMRVYHVPKDRVALGEYQAIFDRHSATLIETRCPTTLKKGSR